MKALVCHQYGPAEQLALETWKDPQPDKDQVLIEVHAASINFPDTLQIQGKYQFQPPMPFIPGSEVSGIVTAVGDAVQHCKPGDRVMAFPGIGGMAEKVLAPASGVRQIPDNMDFRTAAGFAMVYTTSYYALKQRARLQAGETLLVLGASGGVGMAAVELGKMMGARVIAAAGSDEKLQFVKQFDPDELLNYGDGDLKERVKALTDEKGADVIFRLVARCLTRRPAASTGTADCWWSVSPAAKSPNTKPTSRCSREPPWWGFSWDDSAARNRKNTRRISRSCCVSMAKAF